MLKYFIFIIGLWPASAMAQNFPSLSGGRAHCESLWVERNQILNIAGYCFESTLGQAVFNNRDCTPGMVALPETAVTRISALEQAETRKACQVATTADHVIVNGRYGRMRFGQGGLTLGPWPQALQRLDVFPQAIGRERSCLVSGLDPQGDNFLALRSGPDTRYPQIGRLLSNERVFSSSACMGRWCFAERVISDRRSEPKNGWFHVNWCTPA